MYVDDIKKLAGKKQNIDPRWKVFLKDGDLGEPTSSFDHVSLGCTQRECQTSKDIVDNYRNMFESKISAGAAESYPILRNFAQTFPHGPMIWKVMRRNAWTDIVNWKQNNSTTIQSLNQHRALTTTNSRKNIWDLSENCQRFAHIFFLKKNACIGLVLVDLIFYGPRTNLLVWSQNEQNLVTNAWRV